jgi:hypothetical protein
VTDVPLLTISLYACLLVVAVVICISCVYVCDYET